MSDGPSDLHPHDAARDAFCSSLEDQGYRPELDSDGDVTFLHEGRRFVRIFRGCDELYFHLVMPFIWLLDDEEEHARALVAANRATTDVKVAKVVVVRDSVWVMVETFAEEIDPASRVFQHCLRSMQVAAAAFREAM